MKKSKKILAMLLAVVTASTLFGCGSKVETQGSNQTETEEVQESASVGTETAERVVRISNSGVYVAATSIVMKEKQILENYLPENVTVEWSEIKTGPDIRDAIVSKNIDIASFSMMTYLTSKENGLPITLLSFSGSTPIYLYSNSDSISDLNEFKEGDKIAVTNKNTNLHIAFLGLCKKELGEALALDGELCPIPAADAIASLETSDDYDGAIFSFPMCEKANQINDLTMINSMNDIIKEYNIGDAMVVNSEYAKENPDIVEAFLSAQEGTLEFIKENPDEAAEILSEKFGCEKDAVMRALNDMPPTNKITGYDKQADLLYEAGILMQKPALFEELENYDNIPK